MISTDRILQVACAVSGVCEADIFESKKTAHIARGRLLVAYLLQQHMGMSSTEIASYLDKDRSGISRQLAALPQHDVTWNRLVSSSNARLQTRTIVSMISCQNTLVIRCDDGSLWCGEPSEKPNWKRIPTP